MPRPALIARHSLLYSSMIVNSRTALPSWVLICTKSYAHNVVLPLPAADANTSRR